MNEDNNAIHVYNNNYRTGVVIATKNDYFSEPFCVKDDKVNGRIVFSRPTFESKKVKKISKTNNRFIFHLSSTDISVGVYSDFENKEDTLYLYYR